MYQIVTIPSSSAEKSIYFLFKKKYYIEIPLKAVETINLSKRQFSLNLLINILIFYYRRIGDIERKLKEAEAREEALLRRITEKEKALNKMG